MWISHKRREREEGRLRILATATGPTLWQQPWQRRLNALNWWHSHLITTRQEFLCPRHSDDERKISSRFALLCCWWWWRWRRRLWRRWWRRWRQRWRHTNTHITSRMYTLHGYACCEICMRTLLLKLAVLWSYEVLWFSCSQLRTSQIRLVMICFRQPIWQMGVTLKADWWIKTMWTDNQAYSDSWIYIF